MYIPRALWFLATMVALSHASFWEDVDTTLFGGEFKEMEEKVVKVVDWGETFYNNHKTFFEGVEIVLLVGSGLGETGLFAELGKRSFDDNV